MIHFFTSSLLLPSTHSWCPFQFQFYRFIFIFTCFFHSFHLYQFFGCNTISGLHDLHDFHMAHVAFALHKIGRKQNELTRFEVHGQRNTNVFDTRFNADIESQTRKMTRHDNSIYNIASVSSFTRIFVDHVGHTKRNISTKVYLDLGALFTIRFGTMK